MTLTARVENGRIVVDGSTDLPEGKVLRVQIVDDADDGLTEEERVEIRKEVALSIAERKAGGPTFDAFEALAELGSAE
jgi:hypothetical protein